MATYREHLPLESHECLRNASTCSRERLPWMTLRPLRHFDVPARNRLADGSFGVATGCTGAYRGRAIPDHIQSPEWRPTRSCDEEKSTLGYRVSAGRETPPPV